MKSFSRTGVLLVSFLLVAGLFTGCGPDESTSVKSYNNAIVEIQKDMFAKAQEVSQVFNGDTLETEGVIAALQSIQQHIQASHDKFKEMKVPAGAEKLSDAMERFFQIEVDGIGSVLEGVRAVKGKENDSAAMKAFTDTFRQFSARENQALRDFYATQQQVAEGYGQKVIQVEQE